MKDVHYLTVTNNCLRLPFCRCFFIFLCDMPGMEYIIFIIMNPEMTKHWPCCQMITWIVGRGFWCFVIHCFKILLLCEKNDKWNTKNFVINLTEIFLHEKCLLVICSPVFDSRYVTNSLYNLICRRFPVGM